jgi:hypothetical protein
MADCRSKVNRHFLLLGATLALSLVGCKVETSTEAIREGQESTKEIEPSPVEISESEDLDLGQADGFAIYLLSRKLTIEEFLEIGINDLPLDQSPILSTDDILEYTWETHEIKLLPAASVRLAQLEKHSLSGPGLPFVVCVGTERIYGGMFWSSYSSVPYGGIVIDVYPVGSDQHIYVQTGYPSNDWFVGEDLRDDPRIFESLEDAGLLHEGSDPQGGNHDSEK